nr:hypothetical protein GZ27E6_41 [uncultured archaeon GZfos27E6]
MNINVLFLYSKIRRSVEINAMEEKSKEGEKIADLEKGEVRYLVKPQVQNSALTC